MKNMKGKKGTPVKTKVGCCNLCKTTDEYAQLFDCPETVWQELNSIFDYQKQKNNAKFCLRCIFHVSIFGKFLRENICTSGKRPICFMCKDETVAKLKPDQLRGELEDTPFSKNIEKSGSYHACVVCLYKLREYKSFKSIVDGKASLPFGLTASLPFVMLQNLGNIRVSQPHILIKPVKVTAKYLQPATDSSKKPQHGLKRKLVVSVKESPKSKKIKLTKKAAPPQKSFISPSLFRKSPKPIDKKGAKKSPVKTAAEKKQMTKPKAKVGRPKKVIARELSPDIFESTPKVKKSNGKKVSFNNVLDVSYVSENGEIEREAQEEMSGEDSITRRLDKDSLNIPNGNESILDDDGEEDEEDEEIITDDVPNTPQVSQSNITTDGAANITASTSTSTLESEDSFQSLLNDVSATAQSKDNGKNSNDTTDINGDSVTSTTPDKEGASNSDFDNLLGSGGAEKVRESLNRSIIKENGLSDSITKKDVDDLLNDLISTSDKDSVNTSFDLTSIST